MIYIYITRLFGLILLQYDHIICSGACAFRYFDWPTLTNNIPFKVSAQETTLFYSTQIISSGYSNHRWGQQLYLFGYGLSEHLIEM